MNKMVEQANSPGVTLVYRGAMVIAAMVFMWFGSEFLNHKEHHSESEKELAIVLTRLTAVVERVREGTADRYTAKDAARDAQIFNERMTVLARTHGQQISDLKSRVRDLEKTK
jgi:hypothetical protein